MYNILATRFFLFAASGKDNGEGRAHGSRKPQQDPTADSPSSTRELQGKKPAPPEGFGDRTAGEPDIVLQLRSNDLTTAERALKAIHTEFYARLWRGAYRTLESADLAEEAVQEVFIYLWDQRASLTIRGSLGGYLYVATRNAAYKLLRHGEMTARHAVSVGDDPELAGKSAMWPSRIEGPSEALADSEATRALLKALEGLSERDQTVLVLRWRERWGFDEIGKLLGISSVAARTIVLRQQRRLSVFLDRLREELEGR